MGLQWPAGGVSRPQRAGRLTVLAVQMGTQSRGQEEAEEPTGQTEAWEEAKTEYSGMGRNNHTRGSSSQGAPTTFRELSSR